VSSRGPDQGWFEKRGGLLTEARKKLRPVRGYTPVYIIAMGADEVYGCNRNADSWPRSASVKPIHHPVHRKTARIEAGLIEKHPTFVTHGKIYKNHDNTDPAKAKGRIVLSEYNPTMGRVELVALLKNSEWEEELQKLASGGLVSGSMSADVKSDFCSFCGNESKTMRDHCDHIRNWANAILEDGHQIRMINNDPTFIDYSGVRLNADRTSYILAAIETHNAKEAQQIRDQAAKLEKAARHYGLLCELTRKINGLLSNASPARDALLSSFSGALSAATLDSDLLSLAGTPQIERELAKRGAVLPPDVFFCLVLGEQLLEPSVRKVARAAAAAVPLVCRQLHRSFEAGPSVLEEVIGPQPRAKLSWPSEQKVRKLASEFQPRLEKLEKRAALASGFGRPVLRSPSFAAGEALELAKRYVHTQLEAIDVACRAHPEGKEDVLLCAAGAALSGCLFAT